MVGATRRVKKVLDAAELAFDLVEVLAAAQAPDIIALERATVSTEHLRQILVDEAPPPG